MSDWENDGDDTWDDFPEDEDMVQIPETSLQRSRSFTIMSVEKLEEEQKSTIEEVCELTEMSEFEATALLSHYRWAVPKLIEDYVSSNDSYREKVRIEVGLQSKVPVQRSTTSGLIECPQCYDDYDAKECFSLKCGHLTCRGCWRDYLQSEVQNGDKCVNTRCNFYKCDLRVPSEAFKEMLPPELFQKYKKFIIRAFLSSSKDLVWCPGPGCELAVQYSGGIREIQCTCGHLFCFKCQHMSHRPSNCSDAKQWMSKNSSDAENANWILANTKVCPKCGTQIEKNQGCNHMTCRSGSCRFEFCWLCKGDWKDHGSATGGYYKCNIFEDKQQKGDVSKEEKQASDAKTALNRYLHYYSRFDNHDKAMDMAKKQKATVEERMQKEGHDVDFLVRALDTIIECRRVLMWSYVVGYYLEGRENEKKILENFQEMLEKFTEHLHELAEKPFEEATDTKMRTEIIRYNDVVSKYCKNLEGGIEEGLPS